MHALPSERRSSLRRGLIIAGLMILSAASASWWVQRPAAGEPGPRLATGNDLSVVVSGDTAGWLMPCGCTANQSGGLLRRATYVRTLRAAGPVVVADAGGAPGGTSEYHRARFAAILRGEKLMGLVAHNLGAAEAAFGPAALKGLAIETGVPFVSANVRDVSGTLVGEAYRLVDGGGRRLALVGVLSKRYEKPGLRVDDPVEAVLRVAGTVRGQADALIVLAYLPEDELRRLARDVPEADAVIGGPTGQSLAPQMVGHTLLGSATNKGKFIVKLGVPGGGEPCRGEVVQLDPSFADDPEQTGNLQNYLADLRARDFTAAQSGFAPEIASDAPADYRIAGSESCRKCHQADEKSWHGSDHAHAWHTLEGRGFQVDSSCQHCHTTGYGLPGGFASVASSAESPTLRAVGCENCHGPSAAHVSDPKRRTPFAARDQCVSCHDHENSPQFAFDGYWRKVAHGKKP